MSPEQTFVLAVAAAAAVFVVWLAVASQARRWWAQRQAPAEQDPFGEELLAEYQRPATRDGEPVRTEHYE